MSDEDLLVIEKAKELAKHTLKVTSNANRYPKKFRFSLVDKMQNKSLEIYEMLFEANRTDIKYYKRDRLELQTKAITYCDELNLEMAHSLMKMEKRFEVQDIWYLTGSSGKGTEKIFRKFIRLRSQ